MDWSILWQFRGAILHGAAVTVGMAALAILCSTVAGVAIGCLATLPSYLLQRLTGAYAGLMRNLPLVVKLFFLHFVVGLPGIPAALLALTLHQSAYIADITRAGLRSVAAGQIEAGLSLGLRWWPVYRRIVLPQMVPVLGPPMTTQYVSILKNTSVIALIAIQDLTFETQEINVQTFRGFEAATAATVIYGLIALTVISAMRLLPGRGPVR